MLVNKIMQVLKNLFGLNKKISASEIVFKDINNSVFTLDHYLINMGTYSTEEQRVGTWIDGKPIYRKVVDTGTLPNSTGKQITHNISNVDQVINIKGYAYRSTDNVCLPLPHATYDNTAITCYADRTKITIVTYATRSNFTTSYVALEYTKTTD